jgi:hypothetical protein
LIGFENNSVSAAQARSAFSSIPVLRVSRIAGWKSRTFSAINRTLQPSYRHIKGGLTNLSTARGFSPFIEDKGLGWTGLPRHFLENSLHNAGTNAEGLADLENAVSLCSQFHNACFHRGTNSTST